MNKSDFKKQKLVKRRIDVAKILDDKCSKVKRFEYKKSVEMWIEKLYKANSAKCNSFQD